MAEEVKLDIVDSGRVTAPASVGTNILNDNTKSWMPNVHQNKQVRIVSGSGAGQFAHIESNTQNVLVIRGAWTAVLNTTSQYVILSLNLAQVLRDVLGAGSNVDLPTEFDEFKNALAIAMEASVDTGTATGGSQTTIIDTAKNWEANIWVDAVAEVVIGGIHYLRLVTANTADTVTINALPAGVACAAGCEYSLKRPVTLADISDRAARLLGVVQSLTQWGGTDLTGRDISLDLANLDLALTSLRDAICAAGANAKTLNDLYGYLVRYGQLPANITTAGNLKLSIQESAITVPFDLQAQLRALHASTTTALAIDASWTSPSEEILNFGRITGTVFADVAGTIYVEQSPDNTNWDVVDSWSVAAGAGLGFSVELVGRYVRIRFTNGATAQAAFRLFAYKRVIS